MNKLLKAIIEEQYNIKLEDKNISTYQDVIDLGIDLEKLVEDIYVKLTTNPDNELMDIMIFLSELNYLPAIFFNGLCFLNGVYYNEDLEQAIILFTILDWYK